jgi:hypothetical protein
MEEYSHFSTSILAEDTMIVRKPVIVEFVDNLKRSLAVHVMMLGKDMQQ